MKGKYSRNIKISSPHKTIRGMKLKLYMVYMLKTLASTLIVFYSSQIRTLVSMATYIFQ